MAYRVKFSARALRDVGEAHEWYEARSPGLGDEFLAAVELQLKRLQQAPQLYTEVIAGVRRALRAFPLAQRFYGISFDYKAQLIPRLP